MKVISLSLAMVLCCFQMPAYAHAPKGADPVQGVHMSKGVNEEYPGKWPALLEGNWKNQRGSVLTLKVQANDKLVGTFINAAGETKSCLGIPLPVTGYMNRNAVALSINFTQCHSPMTVTMVGALSDKHTLNTLYLVQSYGKDKWNSRIINTDTYHKIKKQD